MPVSVHILISDTNIWIDFRHADLLDALFLLPYSFSSTDFVLEELHDEVRETIRSRGLIVEELNASDVLQLFGLMAEHNNSSLPDVSCYYVARAKGHSLLTGDGQLRKRAETDGITVHGALWLLDELVVHGVVTPVRASDALQAMMRNKARLPRAECERRLAEWLS